MEYNEDAENTNSNEKNIDIKTTFSNLVREEKKEVTQEEAIKNYKENNTKSFSKKANNSDESSEDNVEESEHLNRIKLELLASLERVKQLAKRIFGEEKVKDNLKIKEKNGKSGGKGLSKNIDEGEKVAKKEESEKER